MIIQEIREALFQLQDTEYRDFQGKLIPTVDPGTVIGVRTPELRKLAKTMAGREDIGLFLDDLPHTYFDENQVHAFMISDIGDYDACVRAVNGFLPYVDNWATCDQMSPKVLGKHRQELICEIRRWIASDSTYTVRFAVGMLMEHYLGEAFDPAYPDLVAAIRSDEYYINMMRAWYFATALAKQYASAVTYLEGGRLDPWTHNKTIRKAIESYRITPEQKAYLRALKRDK